MSNVYDCYTDAFLRVLAMLSLGYEANGRECDTFSKLSYEYEANAREHDGFSKLSWGYGANARECNSFHYAFVRVDGIALMEGRSGEVYASDLIYETSLR